MALCLVWFVLFYIGFVLVCFVYFSVCFVFVYFSVCFCVCLFLCFLGSTFSASLPCFLLRVVPSEDPIFRVLSHPRGFEGAAPEGIGRGLLCVWLKRCRMGLLKIEGQKKKQHIFFDFNQVFPDVLEQ